MFSLYALTCKRILSTTARHLSAILEEQLALFFFMGAVTISLIIAVTLKADESSATYPLNSDSPQINQNYMLTSNWHNDELIINNSPLNHE